MPEEDLGTQYQHMVSYKALYSHMNPGIHIDGLNHFSKNVFGSEIRVIHKTVFKNSVSIKVQISYLQFTIAITPETQLDNQCRIAVIKDLDIG